MNVWSFLGGIMPALMQFGSDLFRRYRGDVGKATAHVQRMRDHGAAFDETDDKHRAELERLAKSGE